MLQRPDLCDRSNLMYQVTSASMTTSPTKHHQPTTLKNLSMLALLFLFQWQLQQVVYVSCASKAFALSFHISAKHLFLAIVTYVDISATVKHRGTLSSLLRCFYSS